MGRPLALVCLALLLCVAVVAPTAPASHQGHRHWSTIADGPYGIEMTGEQRFIASDGTHISYAVHMPDVPAGTRVPIIVTAGPYFALLEEPVTQPSSERLSGFLIDNFVSHGYAVVAASVRGTGWSGGCVELMSLREARDIDELITHLAAQPWSDGNVGLTGKSYDGGIAWAVAALGNPHLKTIVPIASVTDMADLLVHHGVPEFRAPLFHPVVYWPFGFGMTYQAHSNEGRSTEDRLANAVCPEAAKGTLAGVWGTYTGDTRLAPGLNAYWAERAYRERVIQNYDGTVFIVHGLQDWNVEPHMVAPFFNELPQEKKMWLGQWGHHYPDEPGATTRADFAETLKAWFDRHLKGAAVDTGPIVEVADGATNAWRATAQWPLPPAVVRTYHLGANGALSETGGTPFRDTIVTPAGLTLAGPCSGRGVASFRSQPVAQDTRLSGIPEAILRFDPATHANVVALVCVGSRPIAHGATNTLYSDGTNDLKPFVPGLPLDVRVELEPMEFTLRAGQQLTLAVYVEDYLSFGRGRYWPGTSPGVAVLTGGELRLPVA